jgi:hypothetical protein
MEIVCRKGRRQTVFLWEQIQRTIYSHSGDKHLFHAWYKVIGGRYVQIMMTIMIYYMPRDWSSLVRAASTSKYLNLPKQTVIAKY